MFYRIRYWKLAIVYPLVYKTCRFPSNILLTIMLSFLVSPYFPCFPPLCSGDTRFTEHMGESFLWHTGVVQRSQLVSSLAVTWWTGLSKLALPLTVVKLWCTETDWWKEELSSILPANLNFGMSTCTTALFVRGLLWMRGTNLGKYSKENQEQASSSPLLWLLTPDAFCFFWFLQNSVSHL